MARLRQHYLSMITLFQLKSLNFYLCAALCLNLPIYCEGLPPTFDWSPVINAGQPQSVDLIKTKAPPDFSKKENSVGTFPSVSTEESVSLTVGPSIEPTPDLAENNVEDSVEYETNDIEKICGQRYFGTPKIVGGKNASIGAWPWQISLKVRRGSIYSHICGATLINENWAVTGAHCLENVSRSNLLLRFGDLDELVNDEPYPHQDRKVDFSLIHPKYDYYVNHGNDIALLQFKEPVNFQPNIWPVCLPVDDTSFVGATAWVTGWGKLQEGGSRPHVLQEVSIPVIRNSDCERMYRMEGYHFSFPEKFLCAGLQDGGRNACTFDSGGPLVIQRADGRWLLAGVTSASKGCARPNLPTLYTRVSKFRGWIKDTLIAKTKPYLKKNRIPFNNERF